MHLTDLQIEDLETLFKTVRHFFNGATFDSFVDWFWTRFGREAAYRAYDNEAFDIKLHALVHRLRKGGKAHANF